MSTSRIHPKVWLKDQPWGMNTPYQYAPEADNDPWSKCSTLVKDFDSHMCASWKDEVSNLLIVAGLFCSVSTAFALETGKLLKEEPETTSTLVLLRISAQLESISNTNVSNIAWPPTTLEPFSIPSQAVRINGLIFISIVLNLMAASIGILCLQWIRQFQHSISNASHDDSLAQRQLKYRGLLTWKVPLILSILPVIIQTALVLFLVGLVDFLSCLYPPMAYIVGSIVLLILVFLFLTTALPSICHIYGAATGAACPCPYKSPQSWVFQKAVHVPLRLVVWILGNSPSAGMRSVMRKALATRLTQLMEVESWTSLDDLLRRVRTEALGIPVQSTIPPVSLSLAWISRTFADSIPVIEALYNCLLQKEISTIWHVNDQLSGRMESETAGVIRKDGKALRGERATEIALLTFLHNFDGNTFMQQPSTLSQHRIELYIRALNIDDPAAPQANLDSIPGIPVRSIGSMEMSHDVQYQLLYRLLRLQEHDDILTSSQWHLLWAIVFRQLESGSLLSSGDDTLLDDIFSTMEVWMTNRLGESNASGRNRFYHWGNGLYLQLVSRLVIARLTGSLPYTTWHSCLTMTRQKNFFRCLELWELDPDFASYDPVCYNHRVWHKFLVVFDLDQRLRSGQAALDYSSSCGTIEAL